MSIQDRMADFQPIFLNETMTLEEFTAVFEALQDEGRDKEATLLAQDEVDLYRRYWVEVLGEDEEDLE